MLHGLTIFLISTGIRSLVAQHCMTALERSAGCAGSSNFRASGSVRRHFAATLPSCEVKTNVTSGRTFPIHPPFIAISPSFPLHVLFMSRSFPLHIPFISPACPFIFPSCPLHSPFISPLFPVYLHSLPCYFPVISHFSSFLLYLLFVSPSLPFMSPVRPFISPSFPFHVPFLALNFLMLFSPRVDAFPFIAKLRVQNEPTERRQTAGFESTFCGTLIKLPRGTWPPF